MGVDIGISTYDEKREIKLAIYEDIISSVVITRYNCKKAELNWLVLDEIEKEYHELSHRPEVFDIPKKFKGFDGIRWNNLNIETPIFKLIIPERPIYDTKLLLYSKYYDRYLMAYPEDVYFRDHGKLFRYLYEKGLMIYPA
jgi:hypothetical protein